MIETYLLKYFAEMEKCKTFSKAAENLYLSPSALSRSMQKLEQIVGVELFTHKKNSIALNDNGKFFAKYVSEILTQIENSVEQVRNFDRKNRTISVGCCAPVPMNEIIFLLNQHFSDVPISSELNTDDYLLNSLREDFFNLVVLHKIPNDEDLFFTKCCSEKLFLAVPKNHPFAEKEGIYLEELNGKKILLYSKIGFWYDLCKEKAPQARFLLQCDRSIFQDLIDSAVFLSFSSDIFLEKGYANPNCVYKPVLDAEADVTYYCVCKFSQKNRFENLFADLRTENSLHKKINFSL